MTKADFYIMDHDGSLEWLGSIPHDGYPDGINLKILIQNTKIMFEEMVLDFLKEDGIIKDNGDPWPWLWSDSRMTDYSYIFDTGQGKVFMTNFASNLVDPIKILQGEDMIGADVGIGRPKFPIMRDASKEETEELIKRYGLQPTEAV